MELLSVCILTAAQGWLSLLFPQSSVEHHLSARQPADLTLNIADYQNIYIALLSGGFLDLIFKIIT